ncbi:hypothetical protein GCM10009530_25420 [Microbispora corallina]|uniref:Uncharacterized protein n=1 Tax=Microbispora corallina TaxID=83302 RepID=A0ABQ4G425_9ACTN|nr:hypothetical protein Mco01_47890 [Microbispora corallina]
MSSPVGSATGTDGAALAEGVGAAGAEDSAGAAGVAVTVTVAVGPAAEPAVPEQAAREKRATAAAGIPARRKRSKVVTTG